MAAQRADHRCAVYAYEVQIVIIKTCFAELHERGDQGYASSPQEFHVRPVPMRYKVDTLFHELLHLFLTENPVRNSVLLAQHAAESDRTKDHLHLIALQKAAQLRLGETEALKDD
jgi:hypothetical protein